NGLVKNFITFSPKPTKNVCHVAFRVSNALEWRERFDEAGLPSGGGRSKSRCRITLQPAEFTEHEPLIRELIEQTVKEHNA
ncbi:MAG: hypothetical protein KC983_06110, partial [Phycisphaerales bacterium]|nr:hypothetical protein [Phycisphaerales bacterium]